MNDRDDPKGKALSLLRRYEGQIRKHLRICHSGRSNRKALSDLPNKVAARNGDRVKNLPRVQYYSPTSPSEAKTKALSHLPNRGGDQKEPKGKALSLLPVQVAIRSIQIRKHLRICHRGRSNRKALSDLPNEVAALEGNGVKKMPHVQSKRVDDHYGGIDFKVWARIGNHFRHFCRE